MFPANQLPGDTGHPSSARSAGWAACCLAGLLAAGCGPASNNTQEQSGPPVVQAVVVPAKREPVSETLPLIGTIEANEMVDIKPETDGIIQEIHYEAGQQVEKGQLLVLLDDSKLAASVAEGEANFRLSQVNHDRARQLLKDHLISQQEYDQTAAIFAANQAGLDLKRRQLRDTRILAPFKGVMGIRQISPGQVVDRTTVLGTLVDLDSVKVEVQIPERYLGKIAIGQKLVFTVAAYPDEPFPGQIFFIAPRLSETLRTASVQARIANPKHELRPGMFASLTLTLLVRDAAIVIPDVALIDNGDATMVFVVGADDTAGLRTVRIGERLTGKAEVIEGLKEGEAVVVEGQQKIVPGAKIRRGDPAKAARYQY
jgi:membrane fusion protein (multidrug efflux system)